jgi:Ser/Thr protein kinase RdoA (MazF antagonist)
MNQAHPYDRLTPDIILSAVDCYGLYANGAFLALNSYENRVYKIEIDDGPAVVAKFYRPGRWSDDAIREEHAFIQALSAHEIPAIAPLAAMDGETLTHFEGFRVGLFPWQPGRAPELNATDDFRLLGRYLGRLHRLGIAEPFHHRQHLTIKGFGSDSLALLMQGSFIPQELREVFAGVATQALNLVEQRFTECHELRTLRLHGDCHLSNVLIRESQFYFVDFDDCLMGPAVQDLWMLLAGERDEQEKQLAALLAGYTEFMEFRAMELLLIEPLRTLRLLRYNAWLAARWDDPAFPHNFPWFPSHRHWETMILNLREQIAVMQEQPLVWRDETF